MPYPQNMLIILKMEAFAGRNFFIRKSPPDFFDHNVARLLENMVNRYVGEQSGPRILPGGAKNKSSHLILVRILAVPKKHKRSWIESHPKLTFFNFPKNRWFGPVGGGRAAWILRFPEIPFVLILAVQNCFFR